MNCLLGGGLYSNKLTKEWWYYEKSIFRWVAKENENLGVYPSAIEIEKISEEMFGVKLLRSEISGFLRGRYNSTYKGFTFKYVEK